MWCEQSFGQEEESPFSFFTCGNMSSHHQNAAQWGALIPTGASDQLFRSILAAILAGRDVDKKSSFLEKLKKEDVTHDHFLNMDDLHFAAQLLGLTVQQTFALRNFFAKGKVSAQVVLRTQANPSGSSNPFSTPLHTDDKVPALTTASFSTSQQSSPKSNVDLDGSPSSPTPFEFSLSDKLDTGGNDVLFDTTGDLEPRVPQGSIDTTSSEPPCPETGASNIVDWFDDRNNRFVDRPGHMWSASRALSLGATATITTEVKQR